MSQDDFITLATPPAIDDDEPAGEQVSVPPANQIYIPPSLADANPWRDDVMPAPVDRGRLARPGVPLIATTPYPGRLVDARTITLAAVGAGELVGYRGGAPNPGMQVIVMQYLDANPTAVVELLAEGFESSAQLGFTLPVATAAPIPVTLPVSQVRLRCASVGTATFVRVGVLVVANDREP